MATHRPQLTSRRRRRQFRPLLVLSTTLLTSYFYAHAQTSSGPTPVSGPAFARTATRLYVLGGNPNSGNNGPPLTQFFSFDLSVPWNATAPVWTPHSPGPAQAIFPATFSADQKKMIVFHLNAPINSSRYDVDTGVWSTSNAVLPGSDFQGVGAITDSNTGLVYMAAGYSTRQRNSLDVYNFATDSVSQTAMPGSAEALVARSYYGNVWSKYRKSILFFGGYSAAIQPIVQGNVVTELVTSTQKWSTLLTSGPAPSMRADHCMATNEDGTMMVVFGGRPTDPGPAGQRLPYLGDVYTLNTVTLAWTQGNPGEPRVYAACTVSNNQLLVWGGSDINDAIVTSKMLVYNLTSASWVSAYAPKAISAQDSGDAPISAGAIAGSVVAGVAVICALVLFFIFRRRRHARTPVRTSSDHEEETHKPDSSSKTREDEELQRLRVQLQNQQEQLDLQRRLLILQQQQQQQQQQLQSSVPQSHVSLPAQRPQLYHDPSSGFHQPVYYSVAPATSQTHSDLNQGYVDEAPRAGPQGLLSHLTPIPMPPIGVSSNPTTIAVAAKPVVAAVIGTKPSLAPSGLRHDSNYWEERPPGNPHAVITP
ncbi:hypothetical protein BGZ95_003725 [Linnemannia exigua]|uniref:Galactose oxidase n=1 Tax=Linnemannia exigua TaxID=604196 RepID=A0AAD4D3U7_9FUNG|nr:hypothetical protein BGZ95_003725 [Linnemannia exigua]